MIVPNCIMGRVLFHNFLRKVQRSVGFLIFCHDSPEVRHGLRILIGIGYCSQCIWSSILLGDRNNVIPFMGIGVLAHALESWTREGRLSCSHTNVLCRAALIESILCFVRFRRYNIISLANVISVSWPV